MHVIFLDIDGVLNTTRHTMAVNGSRKDGHYAYDPDAVALLKRLMEGHDCKLVFTSVKRRAHTDEELFAELAANGLPRHLFHDDWKIKDLWPKTRGDEIKEWLSRHPEVTHFVILDDEPCDGLEGMPGLVHTSGRNGILMEHYWQAAEIFGTDGEGPVPKEPRKPKYKNMRTLVLGEPG